jgi:hypothetical protein
MTDPEPKREPPTDEMLAAYGTMLGWLFIATALLVLLIIIPTWLIYVNQWTPYTMLYVVLCGALGGFVSSLSRLYGLRELPALLVTPGFKAVRNRYVAMYALIPPLLGIVGAAVIYMAMAGGLLEGDMFPKFKCALGEGKCDTGIKGLFEYSPASVKDSAKALVWGVVAGFSERFFPGVLDSLAQQKRS